MNLFIIAPTVYRSASRDVEPTNPDCFRAVDTRSFIVVAGGPRYCIDMRS